VLVEVAALSNGWQTGGVETRPGVRRLAGHAAGHSGHRTHNYMLLVNGKPAHDKNADGLAVPHSAEEKNTQLLTRAGRACSCSSARRSRRPYSAERGSVTGSGLARRSGSIMRMMA